MVRFQRQGTLGEISLTLLVGGVLFFLQGCGGDNNDNGVIVAAGTGEISIRDIRTNDVIDENNPAYIDQNGQMPQLVATVLYEMGVEPDIVDWSFTSSHPRRPLDTTNSNLFLRRYCADAEVDNQSFNASGDMTTWSIMQDFDLLNPLKTFGAVNVPTQSIPPQAQVSVTNADTVRFNIFGINPQGQNVRTYIENHNPAPPHQYAYKMARHESGTPNAAAEMRHFNPSTTSVKYRYTPNFGAPDGWGIMQVDHHCVSDGTRPKVDPAPTYVVWNWQQNVTAGMEVMNWASNTAITRYSEIVRYHQEVTSVQTGQTHPAALPETITIDGRSIAPLNACKIQLYNGPSGVQYQPARRANNGGDYSTRQFCMIYDSTTSSWSFDRNAGHNGDGYVTQILAVQE